MDNPIAAVGVRFHPPNMTRARNAARVVVLGDYTGYKDMGNWPMGFDQFTWVWGTHFGMEGHVWFLDGHVEVIKNDGNPWHFEKYDWMPYE